ncbi:hypothetical protein AI3059V2_4275 [Citrobacter freundii]|nr:hypothetical protein AI2661V1_4274 [Citrobacter freundii]CAF2406143.1 hypothetical protein AI2826V1_4252 [Citrobacter freundii]CAF9716221.1 hypothetical protein AI3059V2_4275 [Citrobacter freundii]CAH4017328.1 hypothetical protein AI2661V1_4274 [Citrobacter freundii]CAH5205528.1 hypothetical protein AI2826V1_4252 [Citrobacter freundii]
MTIIKAEINFSAFNTNFIGQKMLKMINLKLSQISDVQVRVR